MSGKSSLQFRPVEIGEVHVGSQPHITAIAETMGKIHLARIAGEILERQNGNAGAIRLVQESAGSSYVPTSGE